MKKTIVFCLLLSSLYAFDDYMPVSEISNDKKVEYNFINSNNIANEEVDKKERFQSFESVKNIENNEDIVQKEKEEIQKISPKIDKDFVKEYKKDNILQDTKKNSQNTFSKDFSITPKISYMYVSTTSGNRNFEKSQEILPEISFSYENHTIKADYFEINTKYQNRIKFDTTWYRIAYLYKYLNANIGLAYNNYKLEASTNNALLESSMKFPTLEVHLKNSKDQLQVEYGGFYGKNNSDIKYAYEYYLNFGYRIFNNDKLIFSAGYKNRTLEDSSNIKVEYKGPIIGISSTF
jgi:hypothetical protein